MMSGSARSPTVATELAVEIVERPLGPREVVTHRCSWHGEFYQYRVPGERPPPSPCPRCRVAKTIAKRKARARVRQRPKAPYRHVPNSCNFCGQYPLPSRRRAWCSDVCGEFWRAAGGDAALMTRFLLEAGVPYECRQCGHEPDWFEPALEVDHIRPLWSLDDDERLQPRWWLPSNLQLLCRPCHQTKTSHEASQRAMQNWHPHQAPLQGQLFTTPEPSPFEAVP